VLGLLDAFPLTALLSVFLGPSGAPAGSASRSPDTTQASTPASVNVFSLPVGTCFDNPSGSLFSINSVTPIACTGTSSSRASWPGIPASGGSAAWWWTRRGITSSLLARASG
jgi:hypothetical protein